MQAAGMLRGTGAIRGAHVLVLGTLILAFICDYAHGHPLQQLPNIAGWIPVYIRNGDQPLDEINPELAEAFHEKQTLERIASQASDHGDDNLQGNLEHRRSSNEADEDDVGDLNAGARRKGTIFLIGVRQSGSDDGKKNDNDPAPKIALPFEVVAREGTSEGNAAAEDNRDPEKTEDAWIEELVAKMGDDERKPIGISKEAIIKASGLPVDVKELERLAAQVEKEETRPNDLYDEPNDDDNSAVSSASSRHTAKKLSGIGGTMKTSKDLETIIKELEFHSGRSMMSGENVRPARDPKESRPDVDTTDFMESEE